MSLSTALCGAAGEWLQAFAVSQLVSENPKCTALHLSATHASDYRSNIVNLYTGSPRFCKLSDGISKTEGGNTNVNALGVWSNGEAEGTPIVQGRNPLLPKNGGKFLADLQM